MRDQENTVNFHPLDYMAHKGWSAIKIAQLSHGLQVEKRQKYMSQAAAAFKAEVELQAIPDCFNHCVTDVSTSALNAVEKNCMRDCYFKKVTSKDDFSLYASQMLTFEYGRSLRERLV